MVKYISRTNVWLFGCFSLPSRFGGVCVWGGGVKVDLLTCSAGEEITESISMKEL